MKVYVASIFFDNAVPYIGKTPSALFQNMWENYYEKDEAVTEDEEWQIAIDNADKGVEGYYDDFAIRKVELYE